jgi:hypothetical protein
VTGLREWFTSFRQILFSPSEKTFLEESRKAEGKTRGAYLWLLFILVLRFLFIYLFEDPEPFVFILFPLTAVSCLIGFVLWVYCIDLVISKVFQQDRIGTELVYLTSSILVVAFLVLQILALIPWISDVIGLGALLYVPYLVVKAVQSITGLSTWKTLISVVASSTFAVIASVSLYLLLIRGVQVILRAIL